MIQHFILKFFLKFGLSLLIKEPNKTVQLQNKNNLYVAAVASMKLTDYK